MSAHRQFSTTYTAQVQCGYFQAGVCRSCPALEQPYREQLDAKHGQVVEAFGAALVSEPFASPPWGYRNRAKLVVAGTVAAPTLGILGENHEGVDLTGCPLYEPALAATFAPLADFVTRARLQPYDVPARTGELKYLLVTISPNGSLMVRFVLRSTEALTRIVKHLGWLQGQLPQAQVISVNIQPRPAAILEGEREIVLTGGQELIMPLNGFDLRLPAQSFFQINSTVAGALYRQATQWAHDLDSRTVWDLYCGVGGFAHHLGRADRQVTGVETSTSAVAAANRVNQTPASPRFLADDATRWALRQTDHPDLLVVNPPRRGLGAELANWVGESRIEKVLYSSCNLVSLRADLAQMPQWRVEKARVLDMFPQTAHYEVMVLLGRR